MFRRLLLFLHPVHVLAESLAEHIGFRAPLLVGKLAQFFLQGLREVEDRSHQPPLVVMYRPRSGGFFANFFTRTALLTLPPGWRIPMIHVREALYEIGLEKFGITPEASSSLECTCHQLIAFAGDLRVAADQFAAMGQEPDGSEMGDAERRLCRLAGRFSPQVREISKALLDAGRWIAPDGGWA